MVGSIHHAGGKQNLLEKLLHKVGSFKQEGEKLDFYLLGDYNHTEDFFKYDQMIYPLRGTMAGSDYGNVNRPIDAVLTNQSASNMTVHVIDKLKISAPAHRPLFVVEFALQPSTPNLRAVPSSIAWPAFFQPVDRGVDNSSALASQAVLESLGVSTAVRGPLIAL